MGERKYTIEQENIINSLKNDKIYKEAILEGALSRSSEGYLSRNGNVIIPIEWIKKWEAPFKSTAVAPKGLIAGCALGLRYSHGDRVLKSQLRRRNGDTTNRERKISAEDAKAIKEIARKLGTGTYSHATSYVKNGVSITSTMTFNRAFSMCMESRKLSIKDLADKTGIPEKTITRMRTKENYNPSLDYAVICCLAMNLIPRESYRLLECAGYHLRENNMKERAYSFLIEVMFWLDTLEEYDEILREWDIPTFASIIEKRKK